MPFSDQQTKALKAKLGHHHVKTRESNGVTLAYVEGWHVVAEANRIFGFDCWDRQTVSPKCLWSVVRRGETICLYSSKVRVTVRAGDTVTLREGIGTGLGQATLPEIAHETALKAAETDATKRALATFGNPFGLALYDRARSQVTRRRNRRPSVETDGSEVHLQLRLADGNVQHFDNAEAFIRATLASIRQFTSVEAVFAFWSANLPSLAELRRRLDVGGDDAVQKIVDACKIRLRSLVNDATHLASVNHQSDEVASEGSLLIPKEKRRRDRGHLAFVAKQPCLVCGRRPAQAHHLRFAQPRAMALKVSDEFTVPLCNTHHDDLHRRGDERAWWARHGIIEPLKFAARLWAASRLSTSDDELELRGDAPSGSLDEHGAAAQVPNGSTRS